MKQDQQSKAVIDSKWLATEVTRIVYGQSKAKIFNILESQLEPGEKLTATKRIARDAISDIAKNAANLVEVSLGDWKQEVLLGDEVNLTEDELEVLEKEYQHIEGGLE